MMMASLVRDFVRSSGMNRTRFVNILTALHLCDLEQDRENERQNLERNLMILFSN